MLAMVRKMTLGLLAFLLSVCAFSQSAVLKGKVTDQTTGEIIPFAAIAVMKGEKQLATTASDTGGHFKLSPVPPGKWTLLARAVGYKTIEIKGYRAKADQVNVMNIELVAKTDQINEVQVVAYKVPILEKDTIMATYPITAEDIEKMPGRSMMTVASTVAGVASRNPRGARPARQGNIVFVDGVRVKVNDQHKSKRTLKDSTCLEKLKRNK